MKEREKKKCPALNKYSWKETEVRLEVNERIEEMKKCAVLNRLRGTQEDEGKKMLWFK